jgi:hypothetical protein
MTSGGNYRFIRARAVCRIATVGGVLALGGCATGTPPFGRVESVVVNDRYETSPQQADVRIIRSDGVVTPSVSTRIAKGDSIVTSSSTRIVIHFAAGYRVTLDTGTAVYIENPSLFLRIGRAFIEKLTGARDTMTTKTKVVVLHDAGTRYLVTVPSANRTLVTVVDGSVRAEPTDGRVERWVYGPLERGEIVAGQPPRRMGRIPPDELERELRWVRAVERVSRIRVPSVDSMTEANARATLERAGMRVFLVRRTDAGAARANLVVEQQPAAGDSVAPNTFVNLVLGNPVAPTRDENIRRTVPTTCTVPPIVRLSRDDAERALKAAGLRGEGTRDAGELPRVTSQVERAGSQVACGSVVRYRYGVVG